MGPNEEAYQREQDFLDEQFEQGLITSKEYNDGMCQLARGMREDYERDCEEALRLVQDEWG